MKNNSLKNIYILSLGCPKNLVDGENLIESLSKYFSITKSPENAEIIIINTCSFIRDATQESIDAILEASKFKLKGICKKIIVSGCIAGRYSINELQKSLPEVDLFIKPYEHKKVLNYLKSLGQNKFEHDLQKQFIITPKHRAYVKIADGCSNNCAYCTIPTIRGKLKSRPIKDIVNEIGKFFDNGVKEITLIAQDTSAYGMDLKSKTNILTLLEKIKPLAGKNRWIRILYSQPRPILLDVADFLISNEGFAPYLDVPIQHISKKILKLMNRNPNTGDIILKLKQKNIFLRTTVMTGFPSETKKDFNELYSFLQEIEFDHLGAFAFSPEEGTKAFKMNKMVSKKMADERLDLIMTNQAIISHKKLQRMVGQKLDILIEGKDENSRFFGRHIGQAPEIDGIVMFKKPFKTGKIVTKQILRVVENYDLEAE